MARKVKRHEGYWFCQQWVRSRFGDHLIAESATVKCLMLRPYTREDIICAKSRIDTDQLLQNADMALYQAKSKGRGTWCWFEDKMEISAQARRLGLTAGEAHDNRLALRLLSRLRAGSMLLADRGYDADWIRAFASERGSWANVPPKCNRRQPICFSPHLYRTRNLIERFFNKIKQCRRVGTRYDKLAANYLAFIQLASIRLWLRAL
jgi:transposase